MKNFYKPFTGFIRIVISFLVIINSTNAQNVTDELSNTITFSRTEFSLDEALKEINATANINILYSSKAEYMKSKIKFSSKSMTIKKAFSEIKSQAPVEIVKSSKHYIIKERILKDSYEIKGSVKDAATSEPLIATQIHIQGTTKGVVANENGEFHMNVTPGTYNLVFTYMGYQAITLLVNVFEDRNLNISMQVSNKPIQEVDVLGSFNERETFEIGRPIELIDAKTISQLSTNDVNDALHGRVNGVWTTKMSGAPGDHSKIRIRGISSIFGSTDPLYVVDGMIIPILNFNSLGIADLNTHDVKSIVVLKDASSTALYGYLGGNGVILIETHKGGGETRFNFNVKQGLQSFTDRYDVMDSKDFYSTLELSDQNIRTRFYKTNPSGRTYEKYPLYQDSLGNTLGSDNFQDELFQTGNISEYHLSGQGNFKTIDYYISGMYYKHKGVVTNSNYDKYTATGNFSKIVNNKFSLRLLYRGSHQENNNNLDNYMGNDVVFKGINFEPAYRTTPDSFLVKTNRLYYDDGQSPSVVSLGRTSMHPDSLFHIQDKSKIENIHSTNLNGIYHLSNQLSLKAALSFSYRNLEYSSYIPALIYQEPASDDDKNTDKFLLSDENILIFSQQYDLVYKNQFENHSLDAFVRYRNYKDNVYWKVKAKKNVELDGLAPEDNIYQRGSMAIYGQKGSVLRSINSFIGNVNYNFQKKYFISLLANSDNLKEGHYVNNRDLYTSIAFNWDLAQELAFGIPTWVDHLNLSANFGQAGNYPLNGLSNDLFATDSKYPVMDSLETGVYISNLANHYLKDEQVTEMNFGTEISLFKNRIILSADYYKKNNSKLLVMREIPYHFGGGFFYDNIGEMENKGLELSFELVPFMTKDFYWSTKFGTSTNKQYITKLHDGNEISFNNTDVLFPDFYARENKQLGAITGYSYQGEWDELSEELDSDGNTLYVKQKGLAYQKIDTANIERKNLSLETDKTIIGNSIPKITLNWLNVFEYKNFACEMLWYGALGFDKYNATKASTYITGVNRAVHNIVADTMNYHTDNVFYESSFFVEDASYIKLKTLSFSYRLNKEIASRVGMQFKLSFENLITLTKYTGFDPEASVYTNNNFSDNAIDRGSYPNPRGVFFSVNLNF